MGEEKSKEWIERERANSTTIFVDNLPSIIRKIWVYSLFQYFAKVTDCFIPKKKKIAKSREEASGFGIKKLVANIARFQAEKTELQGNNFRDHVVESNKGKLPSGNNRKLRHAKDKNVGGQWKQKERSNLWSK